MPRTVRQQWHPPPPTSSLDANCASERVGSERVEEVFDLASGLAQDRGERSTSEFPVIRHDDSSAAVVAEFDVTAFAADLPIPEPLEGADHPPAGDDGQGRAHAGMSTAAMIGASTDSGSG